MSTLHPNLARIAAMYDEIVSDLNTGKISANQAHRLILTLSAKDDNGVEWSINPENGVWRYRSLSGDLREGEPPQYGMASMTPYDIGKKRTNKFDERLMYYEINSTDKIDNKAMSKDHGKGHLGKVLVLITILVIVFIIYKF